MVKPAPFAAADRSAARDAGRTAESARSAATAAAFAAVLVLKEAYVVVAAAAAVVVLVAARFAPTLETARGVEPHRWVASSRPHS